MVTEEWLTNPAFEHQNDPQRLSDLRGQLSFYTAWPRTQSPPRTVRGKPENFNRPDYNFRLVGNNGAGAHRGTSRCRSACASAARRSI